MTSYAVRAGERVHIVHVVNREGRCAMGSVATTPHSPQNLEGFGVTDINHFYFSETRMLGLSNDTKIVSIGRTVWPQSTRVTDGRTERRMELV